MSPVLVSWFVSVLVAAAMTIAPQTGFRIDAGARQVSAETPSYIGEARCVECHYTENQHFGETIHAKAFRSNPRSDVQRLGCEACHGPGSLHAVKAADKSLIIGFTKAWGTPVDRQNAQCETCHRSGALLEWPTSVHVSNKLGCADCHNTMMKASSSGLLARQSVSETCMQCHPQQRAEFRKRSRMPLLEGKITCADCHAPHGTSTRPLLKADSVNDLCVTCHAEKRGPFLWEHAPVVGSCLNCHQPHGSNHEKLLVTARPYICQQCHSSPSGHAGQFYREGQTASGALAGGGQSPRIIGDSCQNCHVTIHGSNHPAGARFQR